MHPQDRFWRRGSRAASEGGNPRREFRKRERFYEIIVAAGIEAGNPIVDPAKRGQKQHRCIVAGAAQGPHQLQPVEAGYHSVDNQQIERFAHRQNERLFAVGRLCDQMPFFAQTAGHVAGGLRVIFDE